MRALDLFLAALLFAAPSAADVLPEIAKMEAEGEKWFNEATNTDLSPAERNEARKKAWVQLYRAKEALDKHWDEHPGDQPALEDRLTKTGQMVFWLRKESPIGLLESTGVGPQPKTPVKPTGWGDKPPPEKPGNVPGGGADPVPPKGGAAGGAPAPREPPAGPARTSIEDAYKEADGYARKHKADLPGIMERFQAIMAAYQDQTSHPLFLEAAKRAGDASRALKDFYRVRRNDDPDSLKGVDSGEVKAMVVALAREVQSKEPEVRRRAANLLALLGSGEGVFPLVQAAQKEGEAGVRTAEIDAVVAIGGRKAAEHLGKLKDDGDLGMPAVEALGRMCAKNKVDLRLAALELGRCAMAKEEAVAARAVDILVGLGAEGAVGLVVALDSKSTEVRLRIIPALGATKSPKVARPLARFLLSGDNPQMERCREAAKNAIRPLGEDAVPYLFAGLRDPETKAHTALLLREMTGQMFSMSRPGDWTAWWKKTHPDWKEEKD